MALFGGLGFRLKSAWTGQPIMFCKSTLLVVALYASPSVLRPKLFPALPLRLMGLP